MKMTKDITVLCCAWLYGWALVGCASDQTEFVEAPSSAGADSVLTEANGKDKTVPEEELYVYVCGEVANPGVYRLSGGARVYEALQMAGGLTDIADDTTLNQARLLEDGEKIRVPAQGEAEMPGHSQTDQGVAETAPREQEGSGRVNINTADAVQLATLTGIGPSRAEAIIAWREANGGFTEPEDLKKVDGIADKTFDKLKDEITVR